MIRRYYRILSFVFLFCGVCHINAQNIDDIIDSYELFLNPPSDNQLWPIFNEEKAADQMNSLQTILDNLEKQDLSNATESDRINADLLTLIIKDKIHSLKFRTHELPLNAEGGFLTNIIFGIRGARLESEEDKDKFLRKLKELPAYIDSKIEDMIDGQKRGVSSPKLITELCIGMVREVTNAPADQNFMVNAARGSSIEDKVVAISLTSAIPAYQKLEEYLVKEYLPNAPEAIGISEISGGTQFYKQRTEYFATDQISPEEVFNIGMAEVARIKAEMEEILKELEYEGTFAEFCEFLRTDPQFYPKTGKGLLHYAAWITKEMEGKLPLYFNKLPKMPLTVKPVPDAIAANYTTGRYSPGSSKNRKAGEYWVNTTKLESRPLYVMPSLSLHEGVPGHHTQIMLASELDLPDFRRSQYLSAFGEGWALYCEYLGKEAGMYHTPYEDFGRLVYEMWRACRLVVDPGMHYMGWSKQKAFDFLKDNTALSLHEVGTEINRYIGWPGQAISYKLGELKIRSLRKEAETTLGDLFDIRAFHDKILENGSVPMNTLERIVKTWIEEVRKTKK